MSVVKRFASVAAAAVTLLALGMTGQASAGTVQADAAFGGQARAAGLSQGQADALQAKVDGLLDRQEGRQVSANEISLADGATLLVSVPGEKYARDLTSPVGTRAAAAWECSYEYFCMYRGQNGTGDRLALYNCRDYALSDWEGLGSWWNNQTPGTRAQLKDQNRNVVTTTLPASSYNPSYNWTPIWYVKPCSGLRREGGTESASRLSPGLRRRPGEMRQQWPNAPLPPLVGLGQSRGAPPSTR